MCSSVYLMHVIRVIFVKIDPFKLQLNILLKSVVEYQYYEAGCLHIHVLYDNTIDATLF